MTSEISPIIKEKAPEILALVKKANSILLHCHPSPDPDSVGSALATKFALEQLGKKATVIQGESEIPEAFMHFPGAKEIVRKSFKEINHKEFDLFIALDSSTVDRITDIEQERLQSLLPVVNIDHHRSNEMYGHTNLVVETYPATAQILFDLFQEWGIKLTPEIATNLYTGIYTDTGGMKFGSTNTDTYRIMAELVRVAPNPWGAIEKMENSKTPGSVAYLGYALSHVEILLGGKIAFSTVPHSFIQENKISEEDMGGIHIPSLLRSVIGWDIDVGMVETEPMQIKLSFRTRDQNKYDVSKIAVAFGGGGHKAAAGAGINGVTLDEAKRLIVAKAKELYNL